MGRGGRLRREPEDVRLLDREPLEALETDVERLHGGGEQPQALEVRSRRRGDEGR
jgi:hypothetical protein